MRLETFIARRIGHGGRSSRTMSRVATAGVAVSVAVMIIALAVVGGFRNSIKAKMSGFGADIRVSAAFTRLSAENSYEQPPMVYDTMMAGAISNLPGVTHLERVVEKSGVVRSGLSMQGILFKGIGAEFDTTFLETNLVEGRLPERVNESLPSREALISRTLADLLGAGVGDSLQLLMVGGMVPISDTLFVSGIYHSGMEEFDKLLVYGSLPFVQELAWWESGEISALEVTLGAGYDPDSAARHITRLIAGLRPAGEADTALRLSGGGLFFGDEEDEPQVAGFEVATLRERYAGIFDWLDMLGLNTTIVIVIMIVVAAVNMTSGVLILILEQTPAIGILGALGMRRRSLREIFMGRSAGIIVRGMLWGTLAGLALCLAQQQWGLIPLDQASYMVDTVPVHIDWLQLLILEAISFVAITLLMALPTAILSRLTPDKAIRFE